MALRPLTLYCKVLYIMIPLHGSPADRPRPAAGGAPGAKRRTWWPTVIAAIPVYALVVGIAGDALLRGGPVGLGFPLWIALCAAGIVSLVWRTGRSVPGEVRGWLLAALLFSTALAWRDAGALDLLDLAATFAALLMAGIALTDAKAALLAPRLRDLVWPAARLMGSVAMGVLPFLHHALEIPRKEPLVSARAWPVARATLIAGALVLVFGSLLRDADPIFASLVSFPELDFGVMVSHGILIAWFAWIAAGWARGALLADPAKHRPPDTLPFALGPLDVTAALVTLNVLFTLFVASQLGWFFGGETFLRERTGLTAAAYARQGFFEMVWVVALVVPVLLATRALLEPGRALARRHTKLALPIIALLGAIILSACLRMKLYVHYYGLTTDRFYPLVCMGWLALVLVWLALTVLRDWSRPFVAGVTVSGLFVLAALNVAAPDAIVARVNVARAARAPASGATPTLDLLHLASLSGEAVDVATRAVLAPRLGAPGTALRYADDRQRCQAASRLLGRWGPLSRARHRAEEDAAWRTWNAGDRHAMRVVADHAAALRAARHEACRGVPETERY